MNNFTLRRACAAAALLALPLFMAFPAAAQAAFPEPGRPITLVVPFPPGGAADSLGRVWAQHASAALGVPVVVDNRAGANGGIAAAYVAKRPADGYTILMGGTSNMALNAFSFEKLPYDPFKDFDGVGLMGTTSQVLVTTPGNGIRSLEDLVARAKKSPDTVTYGSAGRGGSTHLNVLSLQEHYGIQMIHVPYKGAAPAMLGVMSGEIDLLSDAITTVEQQARAGKVVPLAIFGPQRSDALPGVPTVGEKGIKDFVGGGWYALAVPAGTPRNAIEKLNVATVSMWSDEAAKEKLKTISMLRLPETDSQAVRKYAERDARVWGPVIKRMGLKNE